MRLTPNQMYMLIKNEYNEYTEILSRFYNHPDYKWLASSRARSLNTLIDAYNEQGGQRDVEKFRVEVID